MIGRSGESASHPRKSGTSAERLGGPSPGGGQEPTATTPGTDRVREDGRASPSRLAGGVFILLASATVIAALVTQALKGPPPPVLRVYLHRHLSPNGDGLADTARFSFRLSEPDQVSVSIVGERGDEVRRLADARPLGPGRHRFEWDGRLSDGQPAPQGLYRLRIGLRSRERSITVPRRLFLERASPPPLQRARQGPAP